MHTFLYMSLFYAVESFVNFKFFQGSIAVFVCNHASDLRVIKTGNGERGQHRPLSDRYVYLFEDVASDEGC